MKADFLWITPNPNATNEEKLRMIRAWRNPLLQQCDWTQLPDAILTIDEKQAWQDYRQTLRDIPQDFLNPDDVVFPDPPGGA